LVIFLEKETYSLNEEFIIRINYSTTKDSECVQWLNTNQTHLKQYPYMFTTSEPILGRSLIPCQVNYLKKAILKKIYKLINDNFFNIYF
jgi:hypothetical protein